MPRLIGLPASLQYQMKQILNLGFYQERHYKIRSLLQRHSFLTFFNPAPRNLFEYSVVHFQPT